MVDTKGKVVLAYSGGLDTTVILKWLQDEGYDVVCFIADVGQDDDLEAARAKAEQHGAVKAVVADLREEFVSEFIFPALRANAMYEGRYLLGTSLARPVIARAQVRCAQAEGARYVAHGATGKGNDQVRFELAYHGLDPSLQVIAPWRDAVFLKKFKGRTDLLEYGRLKGIPMPSGDRPPYSMDDNLMHISYESGDLEDPATAFADAAYRKTLPMAEWPDTPETVRVTFKDGLPTEVVVGGERVTGDLAIVLACNDVARRHGVGRIDIVENRFVGIKSRGVYETPGVTILRAAHLDIEGVAMDREVGKVRDLLAPKFAELVYNGFWFAPENDVLQAAFVKAQEGVDGWVDVLCYKGGAMAVARSSPRALYDENIASMETVDDYTPEDAGGFIRINAIRLKANRKNARA